MRYSSLIWMMVPIWLLLAAPAHADDPYSTECAIGSWPRFLSPGPQEPLHVENIDLENRVIRVFKFDELVGEYAKLFIFLEDDGYCFRRVFSVGSYTLTASLKTDGPRLYHADLYLANKHATIGFFEGPPSYEEVRKRALEILK